MPRETPLTEPNLACEALSYEDLCDMIRQSEYFWRSGGEAQIELVIKDDSGDLVTTAELIFWGGKIFLEGALVEDFPSFGERRGADLELLCAQNGWHWEVKEGYLEALKKFCDSVRVMATIESENSYDALCGVLKKIGGGEIIATSVDEKYQLCLQMMPDDDVMITKITDLEQQTVVLELGPEAIEWQVPGKNVFAI